MADQWFYSRNGQKSGPVSLGDLRRLAASGGLSPQDQIWKEGMISWSPASSVKTLFAATAPTVDPAAIVAKGTIAGSLPRPKEPPLPAARPIPMAALVSAAPNSRSAATAAVKADSGKAATAAEPDKPLRPLWVGVALFLFFPLGFLLLAMAPALRKSTAWWAAGIAWALLVIVSGRLERDGGGKAPVPVVENSPTPVEPETAPSGGGSATPPRAKGTYTIGDTFTLGEFKYCITGVNTRKAIGTTAFGEFIGETASAGAVFLIVSYTIENMGSESQTVLSDDFKIQDSANHTFKPSTDANVALLAESDDKDFLLSELQPGLPRSMQQGFEVPEKALDSPITIVVPEKGFFASGKAQVQVIVR